MEHFPTEIWGEIYAFACVDDGRTGRALSLVSRFIHETSKPYKLQSIAVFGDRQLAAFADLIEQTPTHLRRVDCIFICYRNHNGQPTEYSVLEQVLCAISSSVRIIHAVFVWSRPFVLLPVSLPVLEELIMYGSINTTIAVKYSTQFAVLKHLSLSCGPTFLLENVLRLTPSLVNLSISASVDHEDGWLKVAKSGFPTYLQHIFIHTPTKPNPAFTTSQPCYDSVMRSLSLLVDADNRVSLLLPLRFNLLNMTSLNKSMATWYASAAGIPWWS